MTLALANIDIAVLIVVGWLALAFLTAPIVGKVIRGPRPDHSPLAEYEAERQERINRALERRRNRRAA